MSTDQPPEAASRKWVIAFGCYLIVLNLALLYLLESCGGIRFLPGVPEVQIWKEARFLIIVALAGALRSYIDSR